MGPVANHPLDFGLIVTPPRRVVLVRKHVFHVVRSGIDTLFRHLRSRGPSNSVQDEPPVAGMRPVPMDMAAGKSETAAATAATGALAGPHEGLRFPFPDRGPGIRVARCGSVRSTH